MSTHPPKTETLYRLLDGCPKEIFEGVCFSFFFSQAALFTSHQSGDKYFGGRMCVSRCAATLLYRLGLVVFLVPSASAMPPRATCRTQDCMLRTRSAAVAREADAVRLRVGPGGEPLHGLAGHHPRVQDCPRVPVPQAGLAGTPQTHGWGDDPPPLDQALPSRPGPEVIVPTTDTIRYSFLLRQCVNNGLPLMFIGTTGTGKSILVKGRARPGRVGHPC